MPHTSEHAETMETLRATCAPSAQSTITKNIILNLCQARTKFTISADIVEGMNTVAFTPNGLRYLVLPDPIEAKSETIGEITISQQADVHQKASEGTVVAVGDGTRLEEARTYTVLNGCKYKLGDKVIYGKYAGYEHPFDGVEYKVLGEAEILGKRIVTPFDGSTPDLDEFERVKRSFPL